MIPVQTDITEVDTIPGEEFAATIGDARMVMKSLTDLYSNQALATIREYSTNARDSHIEAGKSDVPIEISLPTVMNPYFKVRDRGIGLSKEELSEIYVSYGTSSKRSSNDFNGMLGFGSKSALTYTNTFTVTAVKDGVKTVAIITRKPDYSVILKVVATSRTDEENGVEIVVPVHDVDYFNRVASDFYRFWEPGTVLVNGVEPEQEIGEKIADGIYFSRNAGTSYVVMGNVGYRIANPDALFANRKMNSISFVAFVENGSVEFTPSREDLKYSDFTVATLEKVIERVEKTVLAQARAEIDKATSHAEAYKAYRFWSNKIGTGPLGTLTYKGDAFADSVINFVGYHYDIQRFEWGTRNNCWYTNRLDITDLNNKGLVITEFTPDISSGAKAKARDYLKQKSMYSNNAFVLFTKAKAETLGPWLDPSRVVTWEQVRKATRSSQPKAVSGRIPGSWNYYMPDGRYVEGDLIPDDLDVMWVSLYTSRSRNVRDMQKWFYPNNDGPVVLIVPENRKTKLLRENPKMVNFVKHLSSNLHQAPEKILTDADKAWMDAQTWEPRRFREAFQGYVFSDPALADAAKPLAPKPANVVEYERQINLWNVLKGGYGNAYRAGNKFSEVMSRYVLGWSAHNNNSKKHFVAYANLVFEKGL